MIKLYQNYVCNNILHPTKEFQNQDSMHSPSYMYFEKYTVLLTFSYLVLQQLQEEASVVEYHCLALF